MLTNMLVATLNVTIYIYLLVWANKKIGKIPFFSEIMDPSLKVVNEIDIMRQASAQISLFSSFTKHVPH